MTASNSASALPRRPAQFSRARAIPVYSCLVVWTLITYSSLWGNGFIHFDDPTYVTRNEFVLQGLTTRGWIYAWTTTDTGNWIPLTWLSFQLDATLFGANPLGYHATNLALHIANGLLICIAFQRMTGSLTRSAIVAGMFLVHPMHVESVAWVSERKDVLSTLFLLLTILAYDRYARRPSAFRYLAVSGFFIAGLLSKSMLVTTPLLLLLIDIWPLQRTAPADSNVVRATWRRLFAEKLPLLSISVVDGLITIRAQQAAHALTDEIGLPIEAKLGNRFGAVCFSFVSYLHKTIWPTQLIPYYQWSQDDFNGTQVAIYAAILILIAVLVTWNRRCLPAFFGWWWFVISILPVFGLLHAGSQAYADRYSYIPHIGLMVGLVWSIADASSTRPNVRSLLFALLGTILLCWSYLTFEQVAKWRSNTTLWTHTLSVDPQNCMAHIQLGNDDRTAGHLSAAKLHYEAALVRWPLSYQIQNYLAAVSAADGAVEEAEQHSRRAIELNPASEVAWLNLSMLLSRQNRQSEAEDSLRHFLKEQPSSLKARQLLGSIHLQQLRLDEAWTQFELILKADPENPDALSYGGFVLMQLGRTEEARRLFARLLKAEPRNILALMNSGLLAEQRGDVDFARTCYRRVMALQPDNSQASQRLRSMNAAPAKPADQEE